MSFQFVHPVIEVSEFQVLALLLQFSQPLGALLLLPSLEVVKSDGVQVRAIGLLVTALSADEVVVPLLYLVDCSPFGWR